MPVVARALEQGLLRGPVARALSSVWGRVASPRLVRPLARPERVRLVTIGGATLGGSGKTPLSIACARVLAELGARVALVGHAYRARPGRPRVVAPDDALAEVGDEALLAARELAPLGVPVVVGPTRAGAVALAARLADVLLVDGLLQARPAASLSLLAVDAGAPWGRAGAPPPCGDLRAPVEALCLLADRVVLVGEGAPDAAVVSGGVRARRAARWLAWEELARADLGLITALARPDRVLATLARRGVRPRVVVRAPDHGPVPPGALGQDVDLWLATPKCALHVHLPPHDGAPDLGVLDHRVELSPSLVTLLAERAGLRTP